MSRPSRAATTHHGRVAAPLCLAQVDDVLTLVSGDEVLLLRVVQRRHVKPVREIQHHDFQKGILACVFPHAQAVTDDVDRSGKNAQRFQKPLNPFKEGYDKDN